MKRKIELLAAGRKENKKNYRFENQGGIKTGYFIVLAIKRFPKG